MNRENREFKKLKNGIKKNQDTLEKITQILEQKTLCVGDCGNDNVSLYYCGNCNKAHAVCKRHFENRQKTKQCLVCGEHGIKRRWTIPLQ